MKPLISFIFLSLSLLVQTEESLIPGVIVHGVLDYRHATLQGRSIALDGPWKFFPNQVDGNLSASTTDRQVPSWWVAGDQNPALNAGTFRLTVLLAKEDIGKSLALQMPGVYSAYSLWINRQLIGKNGVVAMESSSSQPQWRPTTYTFQPTSDSLDIRVAISNYFHHRTGIGESIYLGDADRMLHQKQQRDLFGNILFFSLVLFASVAVIAYFVGTLRDKAIFYYACLCLAWALRSIFSNHYLITTWWPEISWDLSMRVEYITIYLSTLFGSLLVGRLFPRDVNRKWRIAYVVVCIAFTLFTLLTPPLLFTRFVQVYLAMSSVLLLSILVIFVRAYVANRKGLGLLLGCLMLAVIMFAYVILSYEGLFELNELVFNGGFLLLFLISGLATFNRLKKMSAGDEDLLTFDQFR